jgi:hypothetical protein
MPITPFDTPRPRSQSMSRSQAVRSLSTCRRLAANMLASLNMASFLALEVDLKFFSSDRPHFCFTWERAGEGGSGGAGQRRPHHRAAAFLSSTHRLSDYPPPVRHFGELLRPKDAWPGELCLGLAGLIVPVACRFSNTIFEYYNVDRKALVYQAPLARFVPRQLLPLREPSQSERLACLEKPRVI